MCVQIENPGDITIWTHTRCPRYEWIVASPCTIGGIADDTVIPANTATQIQVKRVVISANRSLLITSAVDEPYVTAS